MDGTVVPHSVGLQKNGQTKQSQEVEAVNEQS